MKRVVLLVFIFLLTGVGQYAFTQGCSVCTKTAAELDEKGARGLNGGIIYLAFLPLVLIGTVGFLWWKHNKNDQMAA